MKTVDNSEKSTRQYALNLTLAGVAGMAGVITLVIILVALFTGIWLDNHLDTNHNFTIILILASVPLTLIVMFYYVKAATARIRPSETKKNLEEEANSGKIP
jgi:apolipoprotein N-acyltransferase